MSKPKTVPNKLLIGFSDEQLAELDKWRRNQDDLPTRSEVVRRLVDAGVQQKPAGKNWKGYLRLSLVTCPIVMIPATSITQISFDQINRKTGHRVRYVKVDAASGEQVANEDIANVLKGETGSYIEVSKDDLENIALESTHTIEIETFVPRSEIDPLYVIRPYYVVPDGKVGHDAFAIIRESLRSMNRVALARVTMARRERMIALDSRDKGMIGMLLRYPDEVVNSAQYFDGIGETKVTNDMLELAKHIVERKAGHFEPHNFEDYYERALTELMLEKQNGLPVTTDRKADNVINLMDALKRSLAAEGANKVQPSAAAPGVPPGENAGKTRP
jgi:DNA end-binding protein Ku